MIGFPLGLLGLLALVPLTAIYFLRKRRKRLPVSAAFLWRFSSKTQQAGLRFSRYSRELSFLLELLAIVFMVWYLADVRFANQPARHLVAAVDGSLSMSAQASDGQTFHQRALEQLEKWVDADKATQLTIIWVLPKPQRISGASVEEVLTKLEKRVPQGPVGEWGDALRWAQDIAGPSQRIYALSDGPLEVNLSKHVYFSSVGERVDNIGLSSARRVERGEVSDVIVSVTSYANSPKTFDVEMRAGDAVERKSITLGPNARRQLRASFQTNEPILVAAKVTDGLEADNTLTLQPNRIKPIVATLYKGIDPAAVVAVRKFLSAASGIREGEDGQLTVGGPKSSALLRLGAIERRKGLLGPYFTEKGHPLLEDVDLQGAVWTVGKNPPGRPLVSAGPHVMVSQLESGPVYINIDVARSNLSRTAAWPVLLANVAKLAKNAVPGFSKSHYRLGEPVRLTVPESKEAILQTPQGERSLYYRGAVTLKDISVPGEYALRIDDELIDRAQVFSFHPAESNLTKRAKVERPTMTPLSTPPTAPRAIWPLLLAMVLLLTNLWVTR